MHLTLALSSAHVKFHVWTRPNVIPCFEHTSEEIKGPEIISHIGPLPIVILLIHPLLSNVIIKNKKLSILQYQSFLLYTKYIVPRECPTEKIYLYCYLSANSKFSLNWMCSGNALTELGNAGVSKPRSKGAGGLDSAIYRMKLYYPAAKASGRSYCAIDSYSWSVDRDLSRQCIVVSMYLLN